MQNSVYNALPCEKGRENICIFYLHESNKFTCQICSNLLFCRNYDLVSKRPFELKYTVPCFFFQYLDF